MFPRDITIYNDKLKSLNTGYFFDIILLNGIIGVSPFKYIFEDLLQNNEEKKNFHDYFNLFGEVNFYFDLREIIDDIVCFYELGVFEDIVNMKNKLLLDPFFELSVSHSILIEKYK